MNQLCKIISNSTKIDLSKYDKSSNQIGQAKPEEELLTENKMKEKKMVFQLIDNRRGAI